LAPAQAGLLLQLLPSRTDSEQLIQPVKVDEGMLKKYLVFMYEKHLFSILAAAFVIAYIVSISGMPAKSIIFPKLLLYGGVPILVWNLVAATVEFIKSQRKVREEDRELDGEEKHAKTMGLDRPKLIVLGATVLYVLAIPVLGFGFSTIVYLVFLTFYLGVRHIGKIVLYVAVYYAFVYAVFVYWMKLNLPKGILF